MQMLQVNKMDIRENELIGRYYVQLKEVHINWTHRTGPRRGKEAYLPIPSKYAYAFEIKKGTVYTCTYLDSGETVLLKAAGSQGRREYAKQFQGSENLRILYDWYESHNATEGDFVVASILGGNNIFLEFVKQTQTDRINELNLIGANGKPLERDPTNTADIGFRLISLLVRNYDEIICDFKFLPEELKVHSTEPITSLIIGANGTGKSFVMKILSEIFLAVQNDSVGKQLPYDYYCLKYVLNGQLVEVEIINRTVIIHSNGVLIERLDLAVLPQKVLAIAFMLNDKFIFKADKTDKQSIYEYLGMRVTSNAAWTSSVSNRMAENLIDLAADEKLWDLINELSAYLAIDPKVSIAFEVQDSFDDLVSLSKVELASHLKTIGEKLKESDSLRRDSVRKFRDDDYYGLAEFLHGLESCDPFIADVPQKVFGLTFDTNSTADDLQRVQSDYKKLRDLNSLRIIKNITLFMSKHGHWYSFDDSSSGEKHVLYSVLNIARYIKDNSLVMIDEPEISLHPNWQMLYISFLKRLFRQFPSCHFIIASHSPYLVSDLNPESSSLIVLNMENGIRTASTLDYSTYAWSTENILYNVFRVRTTRNFYFDIELRELLYYTKGNRIEKLPEIKMLYSKLSRYVFDSKDPLNLILAEVKEYIENAESNQSSGTN